MGVDTYFAFDFELQLINTSRLSQGDVLVAISYSGKTKTIVDIVKHARNLGVKVIAITNYPLSPLAKNADIVLLTASFAENIRGEIISKRITELCILECLYVNVLVKNRKKLSKHMEKSNESIELREFHNYTFCDDTMEYILKC